MTRKYNNYMTDGTAALKRDFHVQQGREFKVVCTRGSKRPVVIDEEYVSDHTVTYRQYAVDSANDIADAIVYGTAKGKAASVLSRTQFTFAGVATALLALMFVIM